MWLALVVKKTTKNTRVGFFLETRYKIKDHHLLLLLLHAYVVFVFVFVWFVVEILELIYVVIMWLGSNIVFPNFHTNPNVSYAVVCHVLLLGLLSFF